MILHGKFDRNHDLLSITCNHVRLKQEFLPSQSSVSENEIKMSTPISKHLRLSPPTLKCGIVVQVGINVQVGALL